MKIPFDRISRLFNAVSTSSQEIDTLLTDSRSLTRPKSSLFFAIRTPGGNDGHRFILPLYASGVRHFVVNEIPLEMQGRRDVHFIVTDDVIGALQKTAAYFCPGNALRVGITGSRGKTTVKEWIFQLLEPLTEISRSPRSFNSKIGVPLSLWEIEPSTRLALIEAGISKSGEMASLAACIRPGTVIITNIGNAHADGFPSLEAKAREKALLAAGADTHTVIYNLDSPFLEEAVKDAAKGKTLLSFSTVNPDADLWLQKPDSASPGGMKAKWNYKGETGFIDIPGNRRFDLENAAAAFLFLMSAGYDTAVAKERFARLHAIGTRLNVSEGINECSVIYDSYTSDFSSLRPAIDFMMRRAMPNQKPTLILSDFLHETAEGDEIYHAVGRVVAETGVKRFIGVGPALTARRSLFPEGSVFFDSTENLLAQLSPGDFEAETILVKGAPGFGFHRISEMLEARKHETVLEVNLDSIVTNYNYFRSLLPPDTGIVAMVKAFGYGAGSHEIAKTLQDCGAAYLAVAVLDEGIDLRRNGITMPVMVMNPKTANYKTMFANRLEPEIYSLRMLREVIREASRNGIEGYPVHLKLDTGMHRTGLAEAELAEAASMINSQKGIKVESVFSHLATADCPDMDEWTEAQLDKFKSMTILLQERFPYRFKRHILNTAGMLRFPAHHYDMTRLGIGLYGANTLPEEMEKKLAVVSALRTVIISLRELEGGEAVGYGRKGLLKRRSRIATIPIGYADGMNRKFGNGAVKVIVNGKEAPTVGNICMDACMIDVTGIDCKEGDSVEIFGPEAPLQRLADAAGTIPYEILTSVSPRVKRIYFRE